MAETIACIAGKLHIPAMRARSQRVGLVDFERVLLQVGTGRIGGRDSSELTFDALHEIPEVAAHHQPYDRIEKLRQTWRIRLSSQGDDCPALLRLEFEGNGRRSHCIRAVRQPTRRQVVGELLLDYPEPPVAPTEKRLPAPIGPEVTFAHACQHWRSAWKSPQFGTRC